MNNRINLDQDEIDRFTSQSGKWWDLKGEFKALHQINPVRLAYIRCRADLKGKQVLDVGCGGGLLSEALAGDGAVVTGIDMAAEALAVAQDHAAGKPLSLTYCQSTAEAWAEAHTAAYDAVICMELVEHVPDPASLIAACARLVRPGGDLFFSTVNRSWLARLLVIWFSENFLGIIARGTHQYRRFVRPGELARYARQAGLQQKDLSGIRYLPFIGYARLCKDTRMNYLMHFKSSPSK